MTKCYYENPDFCSAEVWERETCGETYCTNHFHDTEKGNNVECVICERNRIEKDEGGE